MKYPMMVTAYEVEGRLYPTSEAAIRACAQAAMEAFVTKAANHYPDRIADRIALEEGQYMLINAILDDPEEVTAALTQYVLERERKNR